MPSIIGNSSVTGNAFNATGPMGFTGSIGATGNPGNIGITAGPTGATGIYVLDVTNSGDPDYGLIFSLSDGTTIGPIFGFTGPDVNYFNSRGVSGAFGPEYSNLFSQVSGGMTFVFAGICGDGQYIQTSLSPDNLEIILTVQNIPSGSVLIGISSDNYLAYTNSSYTATKTNIKIESQDYEDDSAFSAFSSSTNTPDLNFGLTGDASLNKIATVQTFSDFSYPFLNILGIDRGFSPGSVTIVDGVKSVDSGGYVLDFDKSSVFKISTPVGITSFYTNSNKPEGIGSWLLFVDGADVWNLPSNLYFESGITGIQNYAFGPGMNILRVESNRDHTRYYGSFVDRFFGDSASGIKYGPVGSCCKGDGTCVDYVTQSVCTDVLGGLYTPLVSCSDTCGVGSCCINGICYDKIQNSICTNAGGSFNILTCANRGPCSLQYSLSTVTPASTSSTVYFDNSASSSNKKTIAVFNVTTNDTNTKIQIPKSFKDSRNISHSNFYLRDISGNYDTGGIYTLTSATPATGITLALQFDNSTEAIQSGVVYASTVFGITMKNSSNVVKASLNYNVQPKLIDMCGGAANSKLFKTIFYATRYCRDCYTMNTSGIRNYYPIQTQKGTFDFCLDLNRTATGYQITPLCMVMSEVEDINSCNVTNENEYSIIEHPELCAHSEYGFGANNCNSPCDQAVAVSITSGDVNGCKGISLENQTRYPYWHKAEIQHNLLYDDFKRAGITLSSDINSIITTTNNFIKSAADPITNIRGLFTAQNQNKGITFITPNSLASCCDVEEKRRALNNIVLTFGNDSPNPNREIRYFMSLVEMGEDKTCYGTETTPRNASNCTAHFSSRTTYALIFKCYFKKTAGVLTDEIDLTAPNCLVAIINLRSDMNGCGGSGSGSSCNITDCVTNPGLGTRFTQISEIKFSDTAPIPGSTDRALIINEMYEGCAGGIRKVREIVSTGRWYTDYAQYVFIKSQIYQVFWYPLFCSECDGSVNYCGNPDKCSSICFGNSSPLASNAWMSRQTNPTCLNSPTGFRTIIVDSAVVGDYTVLTPKIFGINPVEEKTNEYLYYTLGQPDDPGDIYSIYQNCDNGNSYYKINKVISGTQITFLTSELNNNNNVIFYYTDGSNTNFYEWIYYPCTTGSPTRTAPITAIEKYQDATTDLPQVDFHWRLDEYGDPNIFSVLLTSNCNEQNGGGCVDVVYTGSSWQIQGTKWIVEDAQFNIWFDYTDGSGNPAIVNYTYISAYWNGFQTTVLDQNADYILDHRKFNISGYNTTKNKNIYVSFMVKISNPDAPPGSPEYRLVEKTKVITITKPTDLSLISQSPRRETRYKLITDETTGRQQCVLMDCSVTTDCNTLPDC
jgi:hypothetical protein